VPVPVLLRVPVPVPVPVPVLPAFVRQRARQRKGSNKIWTPRTSLATKKGPSFLSF
jgi:hypothetical protein